LTNAQRILNPFARVVVIGVSGGGSEVDLDLRNFMGSRSSLTGSTLRSRTRKEKGEVADRVNQTLVPRWRTGELHVPVARTFSLDEVDDAYAYFGEPGKFGKVVLRIEG
jgi:NADPH:quinone reductase-like Zn-dependent oxidoreductase